MTRFNVYAALLFAACGSDTTSHIADSSKAIDSSGSGGSNNGGGVGECDINNQGTHSCIDYASDYTASELQGCNTLHGTYTAGGMCDRTGSVGGCLQTFGGTIGMTTTWYYPPIMAADVMVTCTDEGNAVYVTP